MVGHVNFKFRDICEVSFYLIHKAWPPRKRNFGVSVLSVCKWH